MRIETLREQRNELARQAKHMLAERGDAKWSADDQKKFDAIADQIDELDNLVEKVERITGNAAQEAFGSQIVVPKLDAKEEVRKALDIFLRKPPHKMSHDEAIIVRNVMSTGTGSEGGFTVPSLVASDLVNLLADYGAMRRVASSITTSSGAPLSYPTSDGTTETGEWVAENATAASQDPSFGTRSLNTFKAGSRTIAVPIELLQDSAIDMVGFLLQRIADRIGRLTNTAFTVGTGTGQPTGMVTAASVGVTGATGSTTTVSYDNLVDLVDSVDVAYHQQATPPRFMMSQAARRMVRKLKDTSNRPIWSPSYDEGISASMPDRLLGYEVVVNNAMAAPAANARSIAFGLFDRYLIRNVMDLQVFRFEDSAFMTKAQVGFLAWTRVGGNLLDVNAVKLYQHSAT